MRRERVVFLGASASLSLSLIFAWRSIALPSYSSRSLSDSLKNVTATSLPTPTSSPTDSVSPQPASTSAPTSTAAASASPTPTPVVLAASQSIFLRIPNTLLVDPRARSVLLPSLYFSTSEPLLVCIDSSRDLITSSQGSQDGSNTQIKWSGNGTQHFLLSGGASDVALFLNSGAGTRVTSTSRSVSNSSVVVKSVALSEASIDPTFCEQADSSNTRTLTIVPMDLALNMTKTSVRVKS